jgi:hypothetical protein
MEMLCGLAPVASGRLASGRLRDHVLDATLVSEFVETIEPLIANMSCQYRSARTFRPPHQPDVHIRARILDNWSTNRLIAVVEFTQW